MACAVPGPGQAAKELGVREYLTKPVRRDDLLAALGRIGLTGGTILVVEDEPEAQRLFWRMLASAEGHFRVLTAGDGREALEVLEHERPDAILLDLVMPGMDGYHVLDALSQDEKLRAIPVIIISALDPVGHRAVSSAFAVTNKGGLSLQALLAYIDTTRAIAGL